MNVPVPETMNANIFASVAGYFADLSPVVVLICGIFLALFVIEKVITFFEERARFRREMRDFGETFDRVKNAEKGERFSRDSWNEKIAGMKRRGEQFEIIE